MCEAKIFEESFCFIQTGVSKWSAWSYSGWRWQLLFLRRRVSCISYCATFNHWEIAFLFAVSIRTLFWCGAVEPEGGDACVLWMRHSLVCIVRCIPCSTQYLHRWRGEINMLSWEELWIYNAINTSGPLWSLYMQLHGSVLLGRSGNSATYDDMRVF